MPGITDPRDPRGVRHPLVAVLGVAVVATLGGAANFRELGSVAADLPQRLLDLLGARWDRARARFGAPSGATLRPTRTRPTQPARRDGPVGQLHVQVDRA